jgi:membrane fusion protein (multidrug efflux system)
LPAQNATGNWIKIVQRVPVRIALDPREVAANPLQIGLTMKAEVNVRDGDGARLPQLANNAVSYSTDVFHSTDESADSRVRAIIAANDAVAARPAAEPVPDRKLLATAPSNRLASVAAAAVRSPLTPAVATRSAAGESGQHLQ